MTNPSTLESIFFAALEKRLPADRAAFLDEACAGNGELRANLERMLVAQARVGSFLEQPAMVGDATVHQEPPISERPGTVIGPYKLLQQIGEGGMGVVFMAEQTEPIQRTVALKIIKPGMDTRQVIARFEAERQALALMDHPNIARVVDAGTTNTGRPYFVMDLVKGVPIISYCDQQHLSVRQRLELMTAVCHAVQHAHQKGIIHRDLKPSNVLVAEYDGRPVPKVIDFGVSKATAQRLTEKTMFTEYGQLIGTFEYMSPEQARFNQLDVDTRSDIYSLGVVLYEVLAGSTPLDKERLRSSAFDELLRIICEEEPQRPSLRLSTSHMLPSISAQRQIEPAKLKKLIRGELDWIVMKCLEKDRNRRYQTASSLATDLQHYLSDEPVDARPANRAYQLKKFIRRNKASVFAGSAIVAALMVGLAVAAIGFVQVRRQAELARNEASKATAAQSSAEAALVDKDRAMHEKEGALRLAEEKEQLQRRRFYAAQMNLAQQSLVANDPARVLDILDGQRAQHNESDLRGFEWFYLWGQIHRGLRASIFFPSGSEHWGLAISPDGYTIAVSSGTAIVRGEVKLWDTGTGRLKQTLSSGTPSASLLAFSRDGTVLANGSWDGSVCLSRVADGSELAHVPSNHGMVRSLQFSPDGTQLAAGFENGAVQTMDAVSLKTVATLKAHGGPVVNVLYSPDGARLYTAAAWGTEGTVTRVHDMTRSPPEAVDELKGFRATDISPDGRFLVGGWESGITLWDIAERKAAWQFAGHADTINDVKFTADGKFLISAGVEDRLAIVWNIAVQKEVMRAPHPDQIERVACGPKNNPLWASLSNDGTAKVWNLVPPADTSTIRLEKPIKTIVAMPDGHSIMLGGDFQAKVWDLDTGTYHDNPSAAAFAGAVSGDGRWLASLDEVGPGKKPGVKIWDLASGKARHTIVMPDNDWPIATRISPDGKSLATSDGGGPVLVWDLTAESPNVPEPLRIKIRDSKDPHSPLLLGTKSIAFSPDSAWLAAASQFGVVNLYNLKTDQIVTLPVPFASWANQVAFSWDGKLLASGNDQGVVSVFDIEKGAVIASLAGHEAAISALTFFPDTRTLAVGSLGTIRLWDLTSNQERITLRLRQDASASDTVHVEDLAVTPDGKTLVSRQGDGTVRIWKGDNAAADQMLTAAAQAKPGGDRTSSSPQFFARRAIVHTGLGHWDQAMADFQQADRLGIKWDGVLINLMIEALPDHMESSDSSEPEGARQVREYFMTIATRKMDAIALNSFAWEIVKTPIANVSAAKMAVQAAEMAKQISPNDLSSMNTLGIAYFRLGEWQSSVDALQASIKRRSGGDACDWFFLAMAQWQLGDKGEARKWYDKTVAWADANQPDNQDLRGFRAEAAALLGVTQPPSSFPSQGSRDEAHKTSDPTQVPEPKVHE